MNNNIKTWSNNVMYHQDVIVKYYKCLNYHTSLETWIPSTSNTLWEYIDEQNVYERQKKNETHYYNFDKAFAWFFILTMCIFKKR